jgi:hypothetical protein
MANKIILKYMHNNYLNKTYNDVFHHFILLINDVEYILTLDNVLTIYERKYFIWGASDHNFTCDDIAAINGNCYYTFKFRKDDLEIVKEICTNNSLAVILAKDGVFSSLSKMKIKHFPKTEILFHGKN